MIWLVRVGIDLLGCVGLEPFCYYLLIVLWYRYLPGITFAYVRYSFVVYCVYLFYFCLCYVLCVACLVVSATVFCMIACCLLMFDCWRCCLFWLLQSLYSYYLFNTLGLLYKLLIVLLLCGVIWTWRFRGGCDCLLLVVSELLSVGIVCLFGFVILLYCLLLVFGWVDLSLLVVVLLVCLVVYVLLVVWIVLMFGFRFSVG